MCGYSIVYVKVYQWRETDGKEFKNRFFKKFTNDLFEPFSEYESRIIRDRVDKNLCLRCHDPKKYHKGGCHHTNFGGVPCDCIEFEKPELR